MQLGMIGLGRMGANMVRRLMKAGHECVVFDMSPASHWPKKARPAEVRWMISSAN
jgi:6-phosphogluconate dehydrogenase (decarboxylating)